MNINPEYFYTKTHEWVCKLEDGKAKIGISDYAQEELGDLVFVDLPEIGDEVTAGARFADVESVKAVSEVYSPVSGKVCAVNEALADEPEAINEAPYDTWFVEVEELSDDGDLMNASEYEAFLATLA